MIKLKVTCPFWDFVCHVYFGKPTARFKKQTEQDFEAVAGFVQEGYVTNEFILWVDSPPENTKAFGVLSHEVTHLVNHIFAYHDITRNKECDEIPAMLHGYITEKILDKYHAKVVRRKNN